jgi:hypothetical protein
VRHEVQEGEKCTQNFSRNIFREDISPLKVNRRFGGTCRLHLQGRKISQARNQSGSIKQSFYADSLLGLFFDPEDVDKMFLRNVC